MSTRFRRAASLVAISPLVVAASCSSEKKTHGQIMVALSADLSVPENMDEVDVEIFDEDGKKQTYSYLIQPSDLGQPMPGTVAIVPPNEGGQRILVRVLARKGSNVRVIREATAVVPRERVGMLTMPMRWLCEGVVEEKDDQFQSGCGEGKTCKAGDCVDAVFEDDELPDYEPAAVYGGGDDKGNGGTCLDAVACFDKGIPVEPDGDCTIAMPKAGVGVNVAMISGTAGEGMCDEKRERCYLPLDRDDEEGWREAGGRLALPKKVCERFDDGRVKGLVVTNACRTKDVSVPLCGPWSNVKARANVGGPTPPIGGDVGAGGAPSTDGGVDVLPDSGTGEGGGATRDDGGAVPIGGGSNDGGVTVHPDGGACAARKMALARAPTGLFFLFDGSSSMGQGTHANTLATGFDAWAKNAEAAHPDLEMGFGIASGSECGMPLQFVEPLGPVGRWPGMAQVIPSFTSDLPLDQTVRDGLFELTEWTRRSSGNGALVVVSAMGPMMSCPTDSLQTVVSEAALQGVPTHVVAFASAPVLDLIAEFGGAGASRIVVSPTDLTDQLEGLATSLQTSCRFVGPPSMGWVSAELVSSDVTIPLAYYPTGQCQDTPGFIVPPGAPPGIIELCPADCARLADMPGATVEATMDGCSGGIGGGPSAGGTSSGEGGSAVPAGGRPGAGGSGSGLDAGVAGAPAGGAPASDDGGAAQQPCMVPDCPAGPGAACCVDPFTCGWDVGYGCGCDPFMPGIGDPCPYEGLSCFYDGPSCNCVGGMWSCALP